MIQRNRSATSVMYDIALIADEVVPFPVSSDVVSGLMDVSDEEYQRALETLRTIARIYDIDTPFIAEPKT